MTALASWGASLDIHALLWVNHAWSSPLLDAFFSFVTEQRNYIVPAAALSAFWWFKRGDQGRLCLGALVLCVAISDPLASRLIKPSVHRLRPCAAMPGVLTPHGDRGTFSFPSAHAVNIAGAGVVAASAFPVLAAPVALLAVLVGLSRVYLGLHYPSDVLFGYLLGAVIGALCWRFVVFAQARWRVRAAAQA